MTRARDGSTERRGGEIQLRPVEDADLPMFFEFQRDPVANQMAAFTTKDPEDRVAFQAHWVRIGSDPRNTIRTVLLDGRVVGNVVGFVDEQLGKPEVAYWIGREFWGRGVATTALSLFLREFRARPVYGRAAKDNLASIRVLEKCGFRVLSGGRGFANARGMEIEEALLELRADPRGDSS